MHAGQVELYYKQLPENMRSIGGSLYCCGLATSNYMSSLMISIIRPTTDKSGTGNWLEEELRWDREIGLLLFYHFFSPSHKFWLFSVKFKNGFITKTLAAVALKLRKYWINMKKTTPTKLIIALEYIIIIRKRARLWYALSFNRQVGLNYSLTPHKQDGRVIIENFTFSAFIMPSRKEKK